MSYRIITIISCVILLASCQESKPSRQKDNDTAVNLSAENKVTNRQYALPSNCETFILGIIEKNQLFQNAQLEIAQTTYNGKTCQVKAKSKLIPDAEFTIALYVETETDLLDRLNLLFSASQKSKLMFTSTRAIEGLGDIAFYGESNDFHTKSIRVLHGNMTATVTDKAISVTSKYISTEKEMMQLVHGILEELQ